jgi:hypothetical protein
MFRDAFGENYFDLGPGTKFFSTESCLGFSTLALPEK